MKHVKMTALALAISSIAAGSAMAQSAKANAWEGAYAQAGVGYGMFAPSIGSGSATSSTGGAAAYGYPSTVTQSASASNVNNVNTGLAVLGLGYNFGVNESWVVGLGVNYYPGASSSATGQLSLASTQITSPYAPPQTVPGGSTTATYNIKNLYNIALSPGYVIDKDRLAYLKIGYTGSTIGLSGPTLAYQSINLTGYTIGIGYKQMFAQSWYAFGEVNYASYGNQNLTATLSNSAGTKLNGMTVGGNGSDILVGVGYRF